MLTKKTLVLAYCLLLFAAQKSTAQETSATGRVSISNKQWQAGGIFFGKQPKDEILQGRTAFTKKFSRGNGLTDIYFGGPFHYQDGSGAWQDINLDIQTVNDPVYRYVNTENMFTTKFAAQVNDGVRVQYNGQAISFGINNTIASGSWQAQPLTARVTTKENQVQYHNIFNGVDATYSVSTGAISHRLQLLRKDMFNTLGNNDTVHIKEMLRLPAGAVLKDDAGIITGSRYTSGDLQVLVNNEIIFTIQAPCIWDDTYRENPEGLPAPGEIINGFLRPALFITMGVDDNVIFDTHVAVTWLLSPNRQYPVTFDPTVGVGNQNSFSSSYRYPFNTCRQQRVSQILFRKSDINAGGINAAGNIVDISFLQNTPAPLLNKNVEIKMQEVSFATLTTAVLTASGWGPSVYGPTDRDFTSGSNTWQPFTLTTPFAFTNTKNLLLEVSFSNNTFTNTCSCTSTGPGGYWGYYNSPYAGHRWAYSNSTTPPPANATCEYNNSPENNPAYGYFIPATRITINTSGCNTVLTPASSATLPVSAGGGSFAINVTPSTCTWTATASQPWISITPPATGTGDATLNYTVTANNGTARTGTIAVNGIVYTVKQAGTVTTGYDIDGRVLLQGSEGLGGVTIKATPGNYTTTTDINGYYTLAVPVGYNGAVSATLAPHTFSPASLTVSPTNNTGKNFRTSAASISIDAASQIPPWQREGDDYNGMIIAKLTGTNTASWHLEADVYEGNNHIRNIRFPSTTQSAFTFSTATNTTLKAFSKNGRRVEYSAVFDADPVIQANASVFTDIIEKMWNNKNYVFYNSGTGQILIPLKYFPNTISTTISFSRISDVSTESSKITNTPIVQFGNQKYYILNNINSLIKEVDPGIFNYTVKYNPSGFFQESGNFDLTKIGNVHNANATSNTVVVLVGGIRNKIESDINNLSNSYNSQSNKPWSIANDLSIQYRLNTWYIAQSNMNSTQKNAYNLGIALEEIRKQCLAAGATAPNISVIAHSKGGLEMRVLLDQKGAPATSQANFTINPVNPFTNTSISNSLKAVVFLGTPHHGSNFGRAIQNTPGGKDLLPNSALISYLNAGTRVPNIRIANISGYQISAYGNALLDITGDGLVSLESSSESINISGQSIFKQYFLAEDYNPFKLSNYFDYLLHAPRIIDQLGMLNDLTSAISTLSFHSKLHRSVELNNSKNSCPTYSIANSGGGLCQLSVSAGTSSMLNKILAIINNQTIQQSCSSPNNISCLTSGQTWASVLTNTSITKINDSVPTSLITRSDENGNFTFQMNDSLTKNDKLLFTANGFDSLIIKLDSITINETNKFPIVFFKSLLSTQAIKYAKISISDEELITQNPILHLKISSQNSLSYDIATTRDTSFRPLTLPDTTYGINLDTGLNVIAIRFNGIVDSIVLGKIIYYAPNSLQSGETYNVNVIADNKSIGAKAYLNNHFYKKITAANSSILVFNSKNVIDFYRFGYKPLHIEVNYPLTINLNSLIPYSYSSLSDSTIFDFNGKPNPQYWKTITTKNLSATANRKVSAKQYDDAFPGMALKPQTRKFIFRNLNPGQQVLYKTAIALDQVNTPDSTKVYLLNRKGNRYFKYLPNTTALCEYDAEVQKLAFDSLNFAGSVTEELALMEKQPPLQNRFDTAIHAGQTIPVSIYRLVSDPDSIKGDITASSTDPNVRVSNGVVYFTAPLNAAGNISFTVQFTHDFITVSKTYILKVRPPEVYVPMVFTPNKDGINEVIKPVFMGRLVKCHFSIYNRYGQLVYETTDCDQGWDGRIKGKEQENESFVYRLMYQFEGEKEKLVKGTITLIK